MHMGEPLRLLALFTPAACTRAAAGREGAAAAAAAAAAGAGGRGGGRGQADIVRLS